MKFRLRRSKPKFTEVLSFRLTSLSWLWQILLLVSVICGVWWQKYALQAQTVPRYVLPDDTYSQDIYQLAQSTAVRIVRDHVSGTGVIIDRQEQTYTVLTSWHVVDNEGEMALLTEDGKSHPLLHPPQRIGNLDLGIIKFISPQDYAVATLANDTPQTGEKIYAAGFPSYKADGTTDTLASGIKAFRLTQGEISLVPSQSLPEGYLLGYTNDTEMGMSGGAIFNTKGFLVGIHGRGKYRDPSFGVYTFTDGSEPSAEMLETMIESSWGIPVSVYLQFASPAAQN